MTKLQINVTKEVLEASKGCSSSAGIAITNCAISLAIRDVFPKASVWASHINPKLKEGRYDVIKLPQEARDFICEFDRLGSEGRAAMNPISFEIEIPDTVLEQINIDELKPLLENHPTLALL